MKQSKYYQKHHKKENNKLWLTKLLLSIILILLSLIITNFSDNLKESFKSNVLENNISFTKINKLYEKYFINKQEQTITVSNTNDINNLKKEEYNGSYKFKVDELSPVHVLKSGIIVYIGIKDNYENTIIIQGNDGIDIWYSNVTLNDYSLYDYVTKDSILGTSTKDEIIITIMKDGKKLTYDEYFS